MLQEENDKLHLDVEELKNTNAYLKNLNDMLVAEIKDYESTQEKLILQDKLLKQEIAEAQTKNKEISNFMIEKEHLKNMFMKFLDNLAEEKKDAAELLKVLLSLFNVNDKERTDFLGRLKTKGKKNLMGKIL
mmetsp:Transcript_51171/g.58809  ORF Transcript_51171/g.58809 Transcript_51171/m.58809 type:complete len:132 (+) Transcript_51171:3-398(+)